MRPIRLYLFGPLRVAADDRPVPLSAPPRTGPLLAYLALRPELHDRRTLAAALWPDADPDEGRTNLRRHLHYLRQALPAPDGASWILTDGTRLGLDPDAPLWVDVHAFEQALHDDDLDAAVALYAAELLPDLDDDWLLVERERLRGLFLAALMELAIRHRRDGRTPEALAVLERLLRAEPFREDAVRMTMRLRFASGDRAGALTAFERFATGLAEELGVGPMRETQELFQAMVREVPLPPAPNAAPAGPDELPFVGRRAELAALVGLWERARSGHGSFALVGGPAGIGKTRLLRRLADRAVADDGRALVGATSEPEARPYEALADALRPVAPLLTAVHVGHDVQRRALAGALFGHVDPAGSGAELPELPPEAERARLFHAVTRALTGLAGARPLLLVVEDVHAAGEASLALLEHLARRAADAPLLIVASYRDDPLAPDHPLHSLRRRLAEDGRVQALALPGLTEDEVAAALSGLRAEAPLRPDDAPTLRALSAGNPLLIHELIHEAAVRGNAPSAPDAPSGAGASAWAERVPAGVRERVTARLARLGAEARTVAGAAAVAGDGLRLETLCDVLGWSEREVLDALDVLLDARLVRERRLGSYAFRHQLMREAVYLGIDPGTRRHHHRRTAHALARGGAPAAAIAHHHDLGGEPERAGRAMLSAAEEALEAGAGDEARGWIDRGLELTHDPEVRLALLRLGEEQAGRHGDRERQRRLLDAIDALAAARADGDAAFEAMVRRLELLRALGEREAEAGLLERLGELARVGGRPDQLARVALQRAHHALARGDAGRADRELAAAAEHAAALDDARLRVTVACLAAQVALAGGRIDRAVEHLDAAEAAGALRQTELMSGALRASLMTAIGHEAYEEALALTERLLGLAVASGDRTLEADGHHYRAASLARLTRLSEARAHYRMAESLYRELERPQGLAAVALNRSILDLRLGDHAAAAERLRSAAEIFARLGDLRGETLCVLNGSSALLYDGRHREAHEAARRALELSQAAGNELLVASALSNLGDAERHLGAHDDAIDHLARAAAIERRLGRDASMANALCELALAYLGADRLDEAAGVADELLGLLARRDHELLHPQQVAWVAARVRRAAGREDDARSLLDDAAARLREQLTGLDDGPERSTYLAMEFNREITAAADDDVWP